MLGSSLGVYAEGQTEEKSFEGKTLTMLLELADGAICGRDLGSYRGTFAYVDYPRIPGHEFSAEIVEIDENEYGLRKGMIVTCNPYFNCGRCYSCEHGLVNACMDNKTMGCQMNGAFQEYITMPLERIYDGQRRSPLYGKHTADLLRLRFRYGIPSEAQILPS